MAINYLAMGAKLIIDKAINIWISDEQPINATQRTLNFTFEHNEHFIESSHLTPDFVDNPSNKVGLFFGTTTTPEVIIQTANGQDLWGQKIIYVESWLFPLCFLGIGRVIKLTSDGNGRYGYRGTIGAVTSTEDINSLDGRKFDLTVYKNDPAKEVPILEFNVKYYNGSTPAWPAMYINGCENVKGDKGTYIESYFIEEPPETTNFVMDFDGQKFQNREVLYVESSLFALSEEKPKRLTLRPARRNKYYSDEMLTITDWKQGDQKKFTISVY